MPHTLLLADDSVTIQRVIELTFADEDVQVVAVSDGDEAIARIDAAPPDIILADVGMPGKNGYEVAQYVKKNPRLAHIPVVLLTGAFEPVDQARAAEAGCEGVLAKPFEPQLVIGRVRELLGRVAAPAAAGSLADDVFASSAERPVARPVEIPASRPAAPDLRLADQLFGTPAPAPAAPASGVKDVSSYFDRLDQAFATLSSAPTAAPAAPEHDGIADEVDWLKTVPADSAAPEQWDIAAPASASPAAAATSGATSYGQAAAGPTPAVQPVQAPAPAAPLPSLADAFGALLEAEQHAAQPLAPASWPTPAAAPVVTDEVIEQVVQRVIAKMSDGPMRAQVAELASSIAERLVREEIERIKASVK